MHPPEGRDASTELERRVAERLGLDPSQIVTGSLHIENAVLAEGSAPLVVVSWRGSDVLPASEFNEILRDVDF